MSEKVKVAQFEKVSFEEFKKDIRNSPITEYYTMNDIREVYENIKLPVRATAGSAGYDFFNPYQVIKLFSENEILIPTGIRCHFFMDSYSLDIVPRSSLGFRYGIHLMNTIGIIDSDYYFAENEGHIMIKIKVGDKVVSEIKQGERFAQGIFHQYGITVDDEATELRIGGMGSTGK